MKHCLCGDGSRESFSTTDAQCFGSGSRGVCVVAATNLGTARADAVAAVTAAGDARGSVMAWNAATGTPACLAFRQSFHESCQ